jgi:hypothetical protein
LGVRLTTSHHKNQVVQKSKEGVARWTYNNGRMVNNSEEGQGSQRAVMPVMMMMMMMMMMT